MQKHNINIQPQDLKITSHLYTSPFFSVVPVGSMALKSAMSGQTLPGSSKALEASSELNSLMKSAFQPKKAAGDPNGEPKKFSLVIVYFSGKKSQQFLSLTRPQL